MNLRHRPARTAGTVVAGAVLALGLASPALASPALTSPSPASSAAPSPAVADSPGSPAPTPLSETNPYSPQAGGHTYRHGAHPTPDVHANMRAWAQANAGAATGSRTLSYGGAVDGIGVTSGTPKVYLVFWGSQWGTSSTDANGNLAFSTDTVGGAGRLQQMFKGLGTGGELWSGTMTQYCDGPALAVGATSCPTSGPHIGYPTGGALAGVWYDGAAASPTTSTGHDIGVEAVAAAAHFGNTTAASNRYAQYVILSPKGSNPDSYKTGGFCAWHDWNGDTTLPGGAVPSAVGDIAFTNMPYVMDQGTSCGQSFVNAGSAGLTDGYTMVEGHEYAETITDQNPAGGWTNHVAGSSYNGQENADECAWISPGAAGGAGNITTATGSFAQQASWSNDTNTCALTHAIVTDATAGNTVTVAAAGNQSGTVGTATSLQLTATDSSSTATLSWSATGLPAGLSIAAATGLVSGTPTTATTATVTVTATDNTGAAGSTTFSWTIGSGSGGSTCSGQLLGNPGFESGATTWSQTSGVIDNSTAKPARTGTWKAWLDGYGRTHTDTLSQSLTIPGGCKATLTFWVRIDTAETTTTGANDKLTVKAGSTTLATLSNLNKTGGAYVGKTYDLSGLAGQTVTLTFTGVENSSRATSFLVDDTAVTLS